MILRLEFLHIEAVEGAEVVFEPETAAFPRLEMSYEDWLNLGQPVSIEL